MVITGTLRLLARAFREWVISHIFRSRVEWNPWSRASGECWQGRLNPGLYFLPSDVLLFPMSLWRWSGSATIHNWVLEIFPLLLSVLSSLPRLRIFLRFVLNQLLSRMKVFSIEVHVWVFQGRNGQLVFCFLWMKIVQCCVPEQFCLYLCRRELPPDRFFAVRTSYGSKNLLSNLSWSSYRYLRLQSFVNCLL